jgi:hypothetical protein
VGITQLGCFFTEAEVRGHPQFLTFSFCLYLLCENKQQRNWQVTSKQNCALEGNGSTGH